MKGKLSQRKLSKIAEEKFTAFDRKYDQKEKQEKQTINATENLNLIHNNQHQNIFTNINSAVLCISRI